MKWLPAHFRNPVVHQVYQMTDTELVFAGTFDHATFPVERVIEIDAKKPAQHIEILAKDEDPSYVSASTNIVRLTYRVVAPQLDTPEALQVALSRIESLEPAVKAREEAYEQASFEAFARRIRLEYSAWMKGHTSKLRQQSL